MWSNEARCITSRQKLAVDIEVIELDGFEIESVN
jgi:hypothetical protein